MPEPLTLWINARFLSRPVSGVERVAREILHVMSNQFLDNNGTLMIDDQPWKFRLVGPRLGLSSPWDNIPLTEIGRWSGHMWEQTSLAKHTAGQWLLNLCNTGPLLKRQQLTFLHDAQPFAIPDNFTAAFRLWYRIMYRCHARFAHRILVNSHFSASELKKHVGLKTRKVIHCPLGIDHQGRDSPEAPSSPAVKLPSSPFLLAVSSANPNKNFSGLLKALETMGTAAPSCVIVGQQHQQQFAAMAIDPAKVQHMGYVSDQTLMALYRRADALVFPSFYEGFGLPPLEAMAQGCPVIVSNASAIPEVCGEAAEYCDPSDPQSIASAIYNVCGDANRRKHLSEIGVRHANTFTWQKAAKALISALKT